MSIINDFFSEFGGMELLITLLISLAIVIVREKHLFLKKKKPQDVNLQSNE